MAEFSERFFRSGALRIHFRDWGDSAAPPLVLVHGLRDHSHSFDDLARGLVDRFRVLALDLRGHGDSATTPYYHVGQFVLDLHNLVRALRLEHPVVVGHSMGGEVVANYCGSFPDAPRAAVIIEGLGPPPPAMTQEVAWAVAGFERIDQAIAGPPGLADLDAAYRRLRERNPPIIRGRVTRISADSFTVQETGARYFRAEIVVPASELAKMGRGAETLRPGAPVEVVVLLRKRTALGYLLEPLTNQLWRSGSGQ
jgi:pimeloyl-ACP methyl ester carboxylesterase